MKKSFFSKSRNAIIDALDIGTKIDDVKDQMILNGVAYEPQMIGIQYCKTFSYLGPIEKPLALLIL